MMIEMRLVGSMSEAAMTECEHQSECKLLGQTQRVWQYSHSIECTLWKQLLGSLEQPLTMRSRTGWRKTSKGKGSLRGTVSYVPKKSEHI